MKNHFNNTTIEWNKYLDSLENQEDKILAGNSVDLFEKDTKRVLYIVYQMMLFVFSKSTTNEIINSIINISNMNDYEILKCLVNIESIFDGFDYNGVDDTAVMFIIHIACMMTNHKELDIRFFAAKCLIQLTHSKHSQIILPQLSSVMDTGTSTIKASIISRVNRIKQSERAIIEYIIQKGKVDNNYLVRKIANQLANEE